MVCRQRHARRIANLETVIGRNHDILTDRPHDQYGRLGRIDYGDEIVDIEHPHIGHREGPWFQTGLFAGLGKIDEFFGID